MSLAIFSPTPYINKWQMSLCNNSSDNKSYWIHRVDVKVSAQVTTVTYMHQSQPSLHSLRKHLTVAPRTLTWKSLDLVQCHLQLEREAGLGFSAYTQTKLFHHTFVVGVNSELGQLLSFKTKKWGWVRERAGYLGTTFARKEHYRPV